MRWKVWAYVTNKGVYLKYVSSMKPQFALGIEADTGRQLTDKACAV
ncbi:hypothetical protein [Mucilaginibacter endophyticus]|nr:hypothetical protein [Mucilaginibacter endophyticus]